MAHAKLALNLELGEEDANVLREALADYLSDLRMEIADTDQQDFREHLKHRKVILAGILERLG